MTWRIFFYVQHLLGIGHVVRASRLARALVRGGFRVDLVMGGTPPAGMDFGGANILPLPPVKAGAGFADLVDEIGTPLDQAAKDRRRDLLLRLFEETAPDIVLIEAFPFGRRQMDFELEPLIERLAALPRRPLVATSVRDILQRGRRRERQIQTAEIIERHVDVVLVHGDPRLARLSDSFPLADRIAERIVYTGMVGPEPDEATPEATHDVIVSAGGGAVGEGLIRATLAARPLTRWRDAAWLVVAGPNLPPGAEAEFARSSGARLEFVRFVPDLPRRFRGAQLSISQAGYNTVADLLVAGCRSVLVPFAKGGETEQTDRARRLAALGLAVVVEEADLDAATLAQAIDAAARLAAPQSLFDLDGADATATILRRAMEARASRPRKGS